MTYWKHGVSWHKMEAALRCPMQLGKIIRKETPSDVGPNYYATLGKVVQKVFELYFNKRLNLKPRGNDVKVVLRILDKVLISGIETNGLRYVGRTNWGTFKEDCAHQVEFGFKLLESKGLVGSEIKSEVKLVGNYRGFRMFGMVDFWRESSKGLWLWDGKGYKNKNANPNQLRHYALAAHSNGRKIAGAGFLYWRDGLGYQSVDVSPKSLRDYLHNEVAQVRPIFDRLKKGTDDLPATPSKESCKWCSWRSTCPFSVFKKENYFPEQKEYITFGENVGAD